MGKQKETKYKQPFSIIYEDNHLLVVNKTAGLLVQGDKTGDRSLLELCKAYIKRKYNKPGDVFLGVVHRIDRPVSGAVILARTSKALQRMNKQFQRREVKKTYWAVVRSKPKRKSDKLNHWLTKDTTRNVATVFDREEKDAKRAELQYSTLGSLNNHHLLEVNPLTGRPHQIRAQLAAIGCPIRGDLKYGFHKPNDDASINLHAKQLEFMHPVKKEPVVIQAGLPEDHFWEQFLVLDSNKVKEKKLNYMH